MAETESFDRNDQGADPGYPAPVNAAMTTEPAISLNAVRKTFGKKVAVQGIDLLVPKGELVGFIGPNGAGKTTTIRMIMSILFPDSGELRVLGQKSAVESNARARPGSLVGVSLIITLPTLLRIGSWCCLCRQP